MLKNFEVDEQNMSNTDIIPLYKLDGGMKIKHAYWFIEKF